MNKEDIVGLRVTIMGLGLHGGGLSSARFFAQRGAEVTVTDLRDEKTLAASIDSLATLVPAAHQLRYVLGRHEEQDFQNTDLVIKNPAVPVSSPFLDLARQNAVSVETDISIFLSLSPSPLIAVTGSKGKSTTATALHHCLLPCFPGARLGGNITVSPLDFLDSLSAEDPVVLELSSWQLADLRGKEALKPRIAILTNLLHDHQDRYPDMDSYRADKMVLFEALPPEGVAVLNYQDPAHSVFADCTSAQVRYFSGEPLPAAIPGAFLADDRGWIKDGDQTRRLFSFELNVSGRHNRLNLLAAGLAASLYGCEPDTISVALSTFTGIEHRLEFVTEKRGVCFYNDSAATIPEATRAALESLPPPITLITGGTDKNLDFSVLGPVLKIPECIVLLRGSATEKIQDLLNANHVSYRGPCDTLQQAVECAVECAVALENGAANATDGPKVTVLFSPGCASFELFLNEFDRGRRFKELVWSLPPRPHPDNCR